MPRIKGCEDSVTTRIDKSKEKLDSLNYKIQI